DGAASNGRIRGRPSPAWREPVRQSDLSRGASVAAHPCHVRECRGACFGCNLTAGAAAFLIGDQATAEAAKLATRVRAAGTSVRATGDPRWPSHDPRDRHTWITHTDPGVMTHPEEASRRLWAAHTFAPTDFLTATA